MGEKLWVLTTRYNLYDQQGEYFLAAWLMKPAPEWVQRVVEQERRLREGELYFIMSGGGRQDGEQQWFSLTQVKPGQTLKEAWRAKRGR